MISQEPWCKEADTRRPEYYRVPKDQAREVTIEDVAKRWEEYGDKLYDVDWIAGKYHLIAPIEALRRYREYDRTGENALPHSREKIEELKEIIDREGFRIPVHITVYKDGQPPKLSEGNHRLVVAEELGIEEIPVVFFFYRGSAAW